MTDLSDTASRSKAMALVGIAFSMGFMFGPCIGAVLSAKLSTSTAIYMYPSYLAIGMTILNILFVAIFYKESLPVEKRVSNFYTPTFNFF